MSRATLYQRIRAGQLAIHKDGRRSYVTAAELQRYIGAPPYRVACLRLQPPTSLALMALGERLDLWCRHLKGSVNHPRALKQEIKGEVEAAGHGLRIVLATQ